LASAQRLPSRGSSQQESRRADPNCHRYALADERAIGQYALMHHSEDTSRLAALCIDAIEPMRLARFWGEALRWQIDDDDADEIHLVPTDGTTFHVVFEPVPNSKQGQNRIHLDLTTSSLDDQSDTVARLLEVGGRHIDIGQSPDETHVVLADPEGNELCIIEPHNRFLAGCGRLGAINCDGRRQTGHFWSAVLGWPLVWDQDEETAIQSPTGTGPKITWSGPPLIPKFAKNRLHLDIAPHAHVGQEAEVERLISLGATRVDIGQRDVSRVVMADPDDNEYCVLTPG
jgi:predicted enzyme related to lactoylglutathione lyase